MLVVDLMRPSMQTHTQDKVIALCAELSTTNEASVQNILLAVSMSAGVMLALWLGSPCSSFRQPGACNAVVRTTPPSLVY